MKTGRKWQERSLYLVNHVNLDGSSRTLVVCWQAVKQWGISKSMLARLCREGRICGAEKVKGLWMIPVDAQYPADARLKPHETEDVKAIVKGKNLPLPVSISDYRKAYSVLNRIMPGSDMVLSAKDVDLNNADEGLGLIGFFGKGQLSRVLKNY